MALESRSLNCALCRSARTKGSSWRKIYSAESRKVYKELESIFSSIYPQIKVETFLPEDGFWCGNCFRSVEKLIKIRGNLKVQEGDIKQKVRHAGETLLASISGEFKLI